MKFSQNSFISRKYSNLWSLVHKNLQFLDSLWNVYYTFRGKKIYIPAFSLQTGLVNLKVLCIYPCMFLLIMSPRIYEIFFLYCRTTFRETISSWVFICNSGPMGRKFSSKHSLPTEWFKILFLFDFRMVFIPYMIC